MCRWTKCSYGRTYYGYTYYGRWTGCLPVRAPPRLRQRRPTSRARSRATSRGACTRSRTRRCYSTYYGCTTYLLWRVSEASYKHVLRYCQTTSYLLRFTMATFIFAMAGAARPPDHLRATRAAEPATGGVRRDAVREAAGGHAAARAAPLGRHRARGHTGGRRRLAPPRSGCVERLSAGTGTRARARVDGLRGHGIAAQGVWRCPAGRVQRPTERARPSRSIGRACSTATCWGACREGRINAGPTFLSDSVEALLLYFGVSCRTQSFFSHTQGGLGMVGAYYILLFILIPSESATARRSGRKERRNLAGTSCGDRLQLTAHTSALL